MAAGIASFRMYNATPAVTDAWHALFSRVFADLSWPVEVVPFAWPAPLPSLPVPGATSRSSPRR